MYGKCGSVAMTRYIVPGPARESGYPEVDIGSCLEGGSHRLASDAEISREWFEIEFNSVVQGLAAQLGDLDGQVGLGHNSTILTRTASGTTHKLAGIAA
jgi:hypothetical protein